MNADSVDPFIPEILGPSRENRVRAGSGIEFKFFQIEFKMLRVPEFRVRVSDATLTCILMVAFVLLPPVPCWLPTPYCRLYPIVRRLEEAEDCAQRDLFCLI